MNHSSGSLPHKVQGARTATSPTATEHTPNSLNKTADPPRTKMILTQSYDLGSVGESQVLVRATTGEKDADSAQGTRPDSAADELRRSAP